MPQIHKECQYLFFNMSFIVFQSQPFKKHILSKKFHFKQLQYLGLYGDCP